MQTTLTTLRPITFYGRLLADDRCDGLGPQLHLPAGTVCDVLRGNPYKLALCSTVVDRREWYVWTRADGFHAQETTDAAALEFATIAGHSHRLELSADGRHVVGAYDEELEPMDLAAGAA